MRRDHVLRQLNAQRTLEVFAQLRLHFAAGCDQRRIAGHQVSHQLQGLAFTPRQYRDATHGVIGQQARFDFTQLDAEAADLQLMVDATDVLDHAIRLIARQVAGAVQATALGAEWVRHKTRRRKFAALEVAPRKSGAANVEFTDAPLGHRVQVAIEQVPGQVGNRLANRTARLPLKVGHRQRPVGHVHGGFGDAVHVHQLWCSVTEAFEPGAQALHVQCLAAKDHLTQRLFAGFATGHVHQRLERRRGLVQHRYPFGAQQLIELTW
ncbi:hypothetical protein D3C81_1120420 [compost metagenome]